MIDIESFYTRNINGLVRYASSFVSNAAAATDIAVETLIKCWERRDIFESEAGALIYAKVLVKNKCMNYIRHIQSRISFDGIMDDLQSSGRQTGGSEFLSSEITAVVNDAVSSLPDKTRQIFTMSKFDKIPQKDIAQILGISQKTVEYHISQARSVLKKALAKCI